MTLLYSKRELIPIVAKEVNTSWKRLASGLSLSRAEIEIIQEDQDDHERCCKVLDKWCQRHGSDAKIKKLMKTLTDAGLAVVNNAVIEFLGLLDVKASISLATMISKHLCERLVLIQEFFWLS